jgi:hypothetical protein
MSDNHASYLNAIFKRKEQDKAIREMKAIVKDIQFDGFIVTGVSGITMGSIMSRLCRKKLIIIRKENDNDTHSYYDIENMDVGKYIFLDDLIASGNTFRRVKKKFNTMFLMYKKSGYYSKEKAPKIIGQLLYTDKATYTKL